MNIRVRMLTTLLLAFACLGNAAAENWSFEWDRRLPSLELTNVSIEEDNLVDAWRNFIAAHLVRCVLAIPDRNLEGTFQFNREKCTVSDVLDALCATYGCEWKSDPDTGVIWLAPEGAIESLGLNELVVIPEHLRWVPMYTGVLEDLFDLEQPHQRFMFWVRPRWLNSVDYPVSIPAGTYSVYALLNQCLLWNPEMTFAARDDFGRSEIQPVNLPLDTVKGGKEGARLFWQVETDADTLTTPDVAQVIARMGSPKHRDRWMGQGYRRLAVDVGRMPDYLGSEFQNETEVRAGFAYLMSWVPRGISNELISGKPTAAIQVALASERFDSFSPDVKIRLIALALAGISEGGYRQAYGEELPGGSPAGQLWRDPHVLDSHPAVVKARAEDTPMREALLQKLPSDVNKVIAEDDFDLHVFLRLYPWIADYLKMNEAKSSVLSSDWRGVVVDWTAMNDTGTSRVHIPPDEEFEVVNLSEFEGARQFVQEIVGKYGRLKLVNGTPCFVPSNASDSNLSVPVSLDLKNVSTWEALKTVIRHVNCHRRFGDRTVVSPWTKGKHNIPDEFYQVNCITLKVVDVEARDAICMILAQAPLSMGLQSTIAYEPEIGPGKSSLVDVWLVDIDYYHGNQPIVATQSFSKEQHESWRSELKEANEPAEDCDRGAARGRTVMTLLCLVIGAMFLSAALLQRTVKRRRLISSLLSRK